MLNRRLRSDEREEEVDSNGWITTYSDTITLLLTFFILLYSMSVLDNEKLKEVSGALKNQLSGNPVLVEDLEEVVGDIPPETIVVNEYEALVNKVNLLLKEYGLEGLVKVREEDNGVVLQLGEKILFDPAQADIKSESKIILDQISNMLPQIENEVMIQGHTDNVPIYSEKYASNWELSTARAVNVLKYFVDYKNFDPIKISATGYGEHRPIVENNSTENKATNRRVDILIVQQKGD